MSLRGRLVDTKCQFHGNHGTRISSKALGRQLFAPRSSRKVVCTRAQLQFLPGNLDKVHIVDPLTTANQQVSLPAVCTQKSQMHVRML